MISAAGNVRCSPDPHLFDEADTVVMEATYGDKNHEDDQSTLDHLGRAIQETSAAGGNIVIPAFAIGRTQEILYDLNQLLRAQRIPQLLTFVDSPMAESVTQIFKSYPQYFDAEARDILTSYDALFDFPQVPPPLKVPLFHKRTIPDSEGL